MKEGQSIADVLSGAADWVVITGDNAGVVASIPAGGVAAIVCDPPYGIAHKCDFAKRGRDNLAPCNNYADVHGDDEPYDPAPLLAMNVPTVLWGGNHFADRLPASGGWLVWDKERPDTLDQATCELAWTNVVKGVRRFRHLWNGMMRASEHGENYHPTQKPVALMRWVLGLQWMPREGVILDPYCGSGPVGVAAVAMGYRYIGCEVKDSYADIARRRIREATPTLFAEVARPQQLTLGGEA